MENRHTSLPRKCQQLVVGLNRGSGTVLCRNMRVERGLCRNLPCSFQTSDDGKPVVLGRKIIWTDRGRRLSMPRFECDTAPTGWTQLTDRRRKAWETVERGTWQVGRQGCKMKLNIRSVDRI